MGWGSDLLQAPASANDTWGDLFPDVVTNPLPQRAPYSPEVEKQRPYAESTFATPEQVDAYLQAQEDKLKQPETPPATVGPLNQKTRGGFRDTETQQDPNATSSDPLALLSRVVGKAENATRIPTVTPFIEDKVRPAFAGSIDQGIGLPAAEIVKGIKALGGPSLPSPGTMAASQVPATGLDIGLTALPLVGKAAELPGAAKTIATAGREALTGADANVLRVAVREGATTPFAEEGLAASRGAHTVVNPEGVRVLAADEAPAAGESVMFHGTAGTPSGNLRAGTFLTPNEQDAGQYANVTSLISKAQSPVGRLRSAGDSMTQRLGPPEFGGARVPGGANDFMRVPEGLTEPRAVPPQRRLPDEGTFPAIRTDDGSIFVDRNTSGGRTHLDIMQEQKIPPERIVSSGWLKDGSYERGRGPVDQVAQQARARVAANASRQEALGASAAEPPLSDLERQMQQSLQGKKPNIEAPKSVADMKAELADAGQSTEGTASAIIGRYRDLKASNAGGIGTPTSNVNNAARDAYQRTLEQTGDPEAARLASRKAAAQETGGNKRAGKLSQMMDAIKGGEQGSVTLPGAEPPPASNIPPPTSTKELPEIAAKSRYEKGLGGESFYEKATANPGEYKPGILKRGINEALGVVGLPQTMMASGDVSAIARQGQVLGWHDPKLWAKTAKTAVESFLSEDAAMGAQAAVQSSPWYDGLKNIAKVHEFEYGPGVAAGERVPGYTGVNSSFVGNLSEKVPWIKAGERSYATALNVQGFETAEKVAQFQWDLMHASPKGFDAAEFEKQMKGLGEVVNHARGYGTGRVADVASSTHAFFSGRNMISRFQLLTDPIIQPGSLLVPSARQLAAKNLAGFVGANAALLGFFGATGAMAGGLWSVEPDPRSSDFGKVRFGNTRVDTTGGFGPIVRLIVRASTEGSDKVFGTDLSRPNEDVAQQVEQFFKNKESPAAQVITQALTGENSIGQKADLGPKTLASMFIPLIAQDVVSAYNQNKDQGSVKQVAASALSAAGSAVGLGTNTYETQTDYRNAEAKNLTDPDTGQPYKSFADVTDYGQRKQIDQTIKDAGNNFPPSQIQIAGEQAKAEIDQKQSDLEAAFKAGQLTEPVSDREKRIQAERLGRGETLGAFYDQQNIDPSSGFAKKFNGLMGDPDKGTGYLGLTDKYKDDFGQVDFGGLKKAQAEYVKGLPSEDQKLFKSYLDYQDSQKTDFERRRDKMFADKEAAGYYEDKPGETPKDRAKRLAATSKTLDAKNPDLDVESWYYGTGTKDTTATPSLNSPEAVAKALRLIKSEGLQNRVVKLNGLKTPINQSAGTQAAYEYAKKPLAFFLDAGGQQNKDALAKQDFGVSFDRLTSDDQSKVVSKLRASIRNQDEQLDSFLRYFGVIQSQMTAAEQTSYNALLRRFPQK